MVDSALRAQAAARHNAEHMQEYLRELKQWESQVKVKDETLKKKASIEKSLPPVRNTTPAHDEGVGEAERAAGNYQFKQGKYMAAIACYTRGMEYDPYNAVFPANRAMAHLKMKKWG
eukprot:m.203940 g.203940  ORF g.203940 m.203940 type:complete len:117 (+) comp15768_c1_seq1:73-423(+)